MYVCSSIIDPVIANAKQQVKQSVRNINHSYALIQREQFPAPVKPTTDEPGCSARLPGPANLLVSMTKH